MEKIEKLTILIEHIPHTDPQKSFFTAWFEGQENAKGFGATREDAIVDLITE